VRATHLVVVLAACTSLGGALACGARTAIGLSDAIGVDGGVGSLTDGSDDAFDARVVDAEVTSDASTGCVLAPAGIVSWWPAEDTFADLEGRNPGTADGTVTFAAGKVGHAFVLDGASAVFAPTSTFPLGSADRTIELWVYLRSSFGSYPSLTEMFAQYGTFGTTGAAFALFTYGTPSLYWSQWGSSFTGGSISLGVWTHVAATSASGTITLFQDGRAVASQALFPYDTPAGTTFYIGGQGPDPEQKVDRLTGMADEVTVYNRALSPAEIAAIHAAGSAGKCR
jgi:Concanavalin A-like lectin/glucanases superfamily